MEPLFILGAVLAFGVYVLFGLVVLLLALVGCLLAVRAFLGSEKHTVPAVALAVNLVVLAILAGWLRELR